MVKNKGCNCPSAILEVVAMFDPAENPKLDPAPTPAPEPAPKPALKPAPEPEPELDIIEDDEKPDELEEKPDDPEEKPDEPEGAPPESELSWFKSPSLLTDPPPITPYCFC